MTTLFGNTAIPTVAPIAPKKHTLLPLLTVLFLISYGLMTMLIVEQGSTIESQRVLIRELFRDSTELSAIKGKAIHDKNVADTQRRAHSSSTQTRDSQAHDPAVQTPSAQIPLTQTPMTQTPMTQTPSAQTPSTQAAPQHPARNHAGKTQRPRLQAPSRPASDLADDRRALRTI